MHAAALFLTDRPNAVTLIAESCNTMQEVTTSLAQRTHKLSLEDYTPPPSPTYTHAQSSGGGGGANKSSLSSTNTITSTSNAAPRSLALKISRLLSASLEDAGTRTALETLNEFGLDDSNNDNEGAGGVLGGGDRSTKSRRLRAEIDRRLLEDSSRFLEAFKEVNDVSRLFTTISFNSLYSRTIG